MSNDYYNRAAAITPSDTVNISMPGQQRSLTDAVFVGGAGTVTVVFEDNSTAQFTAAVGEILPVQAKRINNTGTAATLLVALYSV